MHRTLNAKKTDFVWNDVWRRGRYAAAPERTNRAAQRFGEFELPTLLESGNSLLDIGSGSGELLALISSTASGLQLAVGVDASKEAIELAAARHACSSARYVCADGMALPLKCASFETVTAFGILEHVRDHKLFFAETARVLKPSGTLLLSSSNSRSVLQIRNAVLDKLGLYRYGYQKNWSAEELMAEVRSYFSIERAFLMHTGPDMPLTHHMDKLVSLFLPSWGRYLCVIARKG